MIVMKKGLRMIRKRKKVVLTSDMGGTNADFAIVQFDDKCIRILLKRRESTPSLNNIYESINRFLEYSKDKGYEPDSACIAVAGTVENRAGKQRVKMTNADIVIDSQEIAKRTRLKRILIINDFEAISYATNIISKDSIKVIGSHSPQKGGIRAVVGAGTGLGKSILCFDKRCDAYIPLPSEGGHCDFPVMNEFELKLADFIRKSKGIKAHISYEDVLSGRGLENIYNFLRVTKFQRLPKNLTAEEISNTKKTNQCSKETFDWFIKFYSRCCRNLALETLAMGGIYIAGGIASKNPESFSDRFIDEFRKHERFSNLLKKIPVYLIKDYDVSHIGAAFALTII